MTPDKIREVVKRYRQDFKKAEIPVLKFLDSEHPYSNLYSDKQAITHCHWMLEEIEKFLDNKRTEKAHRWLGFIQGVLWKSNKYTITELANHNRP